MADFGWFFFSAANTAQIAGMLCSDWQWKWEFDIEAYCKEQRQDTWVSISAQGASGSIGRQDKQVQGEVGEEQMHWKKDILFSLQYNWAQASTKHIQKNKNPQLLQLNKSGIYSDAALFSWIYHISRVQTTIAICITATMQGNHAW